MTRTRQIKAFSAALAVLCAVSGPQAIGTESGPQFPQMQPGQYEETKQLLDVSGDWDPAVRKGMLEEPANRQTICYKPVSGQSPSLFEERFGSDCKVLSAETSGSKVSGVLVCKDPQAEGRMLYEGTATDSEVDLRVVVELTIDGKPKAQTLTASIKMKRVSPKC